MSERFHILMALYVIFCSLNLNLICSWCPLSEDAFWCLSARTLGWVGQCACSTKISQHHDVLTQRYFLMRMLLWHYIKIAGNLSSGLIGQRSQTSEMSKVILLEQLWAMDVVSHQPPKPDEVAHQEQGSTRVHLATFCSTMIMTKGRVWKAHTWDWEQLTCI